MTITPNFNAKVRFKIKGQEALPKWQQEAIKNGLNSPEGPPEALRFQCRIAQDAQENLASISLPDGSTLSLHKKARPQFGKNRDGLPFLTATLTHDATGESYRFSWVGSNVPEVMLVTAVKHDMGKKAAAKTVTLDLAKAQVTPVHKANGIKHKSKRDNKAEGDRRKQLRDAGIEPQKRAPRHCARVTAGDLPQKGAMA